jgi:translation initiation factor IF-2
MIRSAGERARIVAEQQAKEKAEAEARRYEEEAAGRRLLDGGILSPGRETPTDPDALAGLVDAGADARAAAILSGAEPVQVPVAQEKPAREEPDAGYDPDEAGEFPSESDGDDTKGTDIVEGAIEDVLRKGKHETETA